MTFSEIKDSVDPEEATFLIARMRHTLAELRDSLPVLTKDEEFQVRRNMLAVLGYPIARDREELDAITRTLRKAAYPGRSGGIH